MTGSGGSGGGWGIGAGSGSGVGFAVGLWLGALRRWSRTPAAPAVSHTLADLLGWWLR